MKALHSRWLRLAHADGFLHLGGLLLLVIVAGGGYLYASTHRAQIDSKLQSAGLPRPFKVDYTVVGKQASKDGSYLLVLRQGADVETMDVSRAFYTATRLGDHVKH